jgi:hypothetical protein
VQGTNAQAPPLVTPAFTLVQDDAQHDDNPTEDARHRGVASNGPQGTFR